MARVPTFHEPQRSVSTLQGVVRRKHAEAWTPNSAPLVHGPDARPKLEVEAAHEPPCRSAGWQPAVSPTGSRLDTEMWHGCRFPIRATVQGRMARTKSGGFSPGGEGQGGRS